jgi:hypothetical protein
MPTPALLCGGQAGVGCPKNAMPAEVDDHHVALSVRWGLCGHVCSLAKADMQALMKLRRRMGLHAMRYADTPASGAATENNFDVGSRLKTLTRCFTVNL